MALQGTLETFSVPEVLRLLSGTAKTGLLALQGDRGAGKVWFTEGRIVAAHSDHEQGDRVDAVLFDLLRYESGSFVFDPGTLPDGDTTGDVDVEDVLVEAERMLVAWREIEAVVPSLDVQVQLVDELSGDSVTVTADQWRSLALVGSGISARRLGAHLGVGEFDACSAVRDLVDAGLVDVSEPVSEPEGPAPSSDPQPEVEAPVDVEADVEVEIEVEVEADDEPGDPVVEQAAPEVTVDAGAHELTDAETELPETQDDADSGEFLSQLANFSPKAAAALEATAEEPTALDEEIAAAAEDDEEINRNLLLKFLSSAKN
ncbi:MAG: DUF4388 domain-containing protein [Acidimicrobiales bacterium]